MRAQLVIFAAIAIAVVMQAPVQAAPPPPRSRPPTPTSFVCNATTATALGDSITSAINEALLPNATNTKTNSSKNTYYSFTVPKYCFGNLFGYGFEVSSFQIAFC